MSLKYHNGTTWVPLDIGTADYSALIFNDLLSGVANGVNAVFSTTRNFASVSVYVNGQKMTPGINNDYTVTGANQITFTSTSIPPKDAVVTADLSTSASYTVTGTNSFVLKQAVTGLINGINATYTTASAYVGGTLQVFVNGVRQGIAHVTETNPGAGTFTLDKAPSTGSNVEVGYMVGGIASGNADSVDTFHASQSVLPNTIPVTNANSKLPQAVIPGYAFKARRATNLSSGSNAGIDIVFDQEAYDYGDWYNPSTGLATAPVNGIYRFTANAFTETVTTTRSFYTSRGTGVTGTNPNGTSKNVERTRDGAQTNINRIEGNWELYLDAGQTFGVSLWTSAVNQLNSQDTWLAGHLVMQVGV